MAKLYRFDMKNDKYIVIEQSTDQIISSVATKEQVKDLVRMLNAGSGFNGQTPQFFIIPLGEKHAEIFKGERQEKTKDVV